MNNERKKQLKQEYTQKRPGMGILCIKHIDSGACFLMGAKDVNATRNRFTLQLRTGSHPDRDLQALWKEHTQSAFEITVCRELPYDEKDPEKTDYSQELMELLQQALADIPESRIIKIPGRKGLL